jgi:Hexokinase
MDLDDDDSVVVAFCGSVMEKYCTFRERCQGILDELVKYPCIYRSDTNDGLKNGVHGDMGDGIQALKNAVAQVDQRRVILEENSDGGILGAGILAAVMDTKHTISKKS